MAHIVVMGAGIGGMPMAYEMKELLRTGDRVTVIGNGPNFHFVPSNPWVAVNWRARTAIEFPVRPCLEKRGIAFDPRGAKRVIPEKNQVELNDGVLVDYDFLSVATGPKLAFVEIEGLGPQGNTHSICHVDHAADAARDWIRSCRIPGRSSSVPSRAHPASDPPTSSASSWRRTSAGGKSATRCR